MTTITTTTTPASAVAVLQLPLLLQSIPNTAELVLTTQQFPVCSYNSVTQFSHYVTSIQVQDNNSVQKQCSTRREDDVPVNDRTGFVEIQSLTAATQTHDSRSPASAE